MAFGRASKASHWLMAKTRVTPSLYVIADQGSVLIGYSYEPSGSSTRENNIVESPLEPWTLVAGTKRGQADGDDDVHRSKHVPLWRSGVNVS